VAKSVVTCDCNGTSDIEMLGVRPWHDPIVPPLMIVAGVATCGSSLEGAGSSPGYLRT